MRARGQDAELLRLDEAERRLRPFAQRYVGIQTIPLAQVVGTDSRVRDFDRNFVPRRPEVRSRRRQVECAFPDGAFPPIVVSKLGDAYFVVDGHHRVAIARRRGMETIDAEVTELRARWHLDADANAEELMRAEQYRLFMEQSGLEEVRPDACIRFTQPTAYDELLAHVHSYGYLRMRETGRLLEPAEVAAEWYDRVYLCALETFGREGLEPKTTAGDLFMCVTERRRELQVSCSCTTFEDAARHVRASDYEPRRPVLRRLFTKPT
jgi:ParB-like nuclease domain